jgi:hypothetical protein
VKITYRNDRNGDLAHFDEPDERLEALPNWHRVDAKELAALEQPEPEPEAPTEPEQEPEQELEAPTEPAPAPAPAAKPARPSRARKPAAKKG